MLLLQLLDDKILDKDEFVNEKYKIPIFIGMKGRMENCSSV